MKRILLCGFVVLSFFGLMVIARGGGGGRGGGFGGGHMGGGAGRSMGHSGNYNHGNHRNNHGWNNGVYVGAGLGLWGGAPFWPAGYTYTSYCDEYPDDERCRRDYSE